MTDSIPITETITLTDGDALLIIRNTGKVTVIAKIPPSDKHPNIAAIVAAYHCITLIDGEHDDLREALAEDAEDNFEKAIRSHEETDSSSHPH